MVAGIVDAADRAIHARGDEPPRGVFAQQQVLDAQPGVARRIANLPFVTPKRTRCDVMSAQEQTHARVMSALPPKADIS